MGKQVSVEEFPWDRWLRMGAYGIGELIEEEDIDNGFAVLPPIGYKDGEAL